MADLKISAAADPGTLLATDKTPIARSGSTTAYAATMAEFASYANTAYVPNYATGAPFMDGTAAPGVANNVSRGDHIHPSDTSRAPLASPTFTGTPASTTPTTGDNSTRIATTAFVQSQMVASGAGVSTWNTRAGAVVLQQSDITAVGALHDVGRNLLHNSMFNVAQRGVGPFTTNGYTLDRWTHAIASDTFSATQVALADAHRSQIGDEAARYCYGNTFTGNAAASAFDLVIQYIEDVYRLAGKTVTVSFWAWSAAGTPKLGVGLGQFFGTGGSPSTIVHLNGQTVTLNTTATRYSVTFSMPSIAGKTFGTNGNHATELDFWYSSGTNFTSRSGDVGVQSGAINLWGIQLEIGTQATPLEKPDPRYDLANCQRFYQVGYFNNGGYTGGVAGAPITIPFPVPMRIAPTLVPNFTTQTNCGSSSISNAGGGYGFYVSTVTSAAGGWALGGTFTASADL